MSETDNTQLTVKINIDRCAGHGKCREEVPDVFGYDAVTNKARILDGADINGQREAVTLAIRACPEFALAWAPVEPIASDGETP